MWEPWGIITWGLQNKTIGRVEGGMDGRETLWEEKVRALSSRVDTHHEEGGEFNEAQISHLGKSMDNGDINGNMNDRRQANLRSGWEMGKSKV